MILNEKREREKIVGRFWERELESEREGGRLVRLARKRDGTCGGGPDRRKEECVTERVANRGGLPGNLNLLE